ncbi:MAG: ethylbenzene dehydrogenase-related protein [Thermoleophilia bacterium]
MDRITRRALVGSGALVVAGVTLGGVLGALSKRPEAKVADRIRARRIDRVPAEDPASEAWYEAAPIVVPLGPQQAVPPYLGSASIAELVVEALHDDDELALRLGWDDPSQDDLSGIGRFGDAVAVQLPTAAGGTPAITMGAPGAPVHVVQWRASWQRDLVERTGVETLYPGLARDTIPEDVFPAETAVLWYPGRAAGNAISAAGRSSSIQELVAEGFGTLTPLPDQRARGAAAWADGRWTVALGFPLDRAGAGDALAPGTSWPVAFAVWAGSDGNRGGRKHFADWKTLEVRA